MLLLADRIPADPTPDCAVRRLLGVGARSRAGRCTRRRRRRSSRSCPASNVIVATPTGSGKSLVAAGAHFAALAEGRRTFYTAPDQGAREREVLRPVPHVRARARRDDDRRRGRQRRRARSSAAPPRSSPTSPCASGDRRRRRPGGDGRVPLLRRPRPRAGRGRCRCSTLPHAQFDPDVGDARRRHRPRGRPHPAHRPAHDHRPVGDPAGAAATGRSA